MNDQHTKQPRSPVLAFVHIHKTAGTTLKSILRTSFGRGHCDTNHVRSAAFTTEDYRRAQRIFPGLKSLCGHNLAPVAHRLPPEVAYYTILREPIRRTASHYQDACVRGSETRSLEEWLADPARRNAQVRHLAGSEDLEAAKAVLQGEYLFAGLAERFEDSLRLLAYHSPYPLDLRFAARNTARDDSIKRRILEDPEQRALVARANELDCELYSYVAEQAFPESLAQLPTDSIPQPTATKHGRRTFHDRISDQYNKVVWRQFNKWRNRRLDR